MRALTYFIATTLDGHIAGPDRGDPTGPDGWWPMAEDYVAHLVAHYPEALPGPARSALGITEEGTLFDTVVSGRRTYQIGLDAGLTNAYPHLSQVVFSRSLPPSTDPGVEVVDSDPVEAVRALKQRDGKGIWLVGGGDLAGALHDEIDVLVLKVSPMTLGSGVALFGESSFAPRLWSLRESVVLDSGALFLTYDRVRD
ncbi:dihydrofolate reductase family protein [Nocardioides sp. Root140]|uniref:dihydrofolate reductase family protein n=1 Tax=Nocardioides sp. Root140 TaxID=1736460 RepID=UPI0006FCF007|nr:dihydrofolate reductase family protein [Nocardioides sp. Root140]KQY57680.1 deaminase [Nocardioides sp. Root140]